MNSAELAALRATATTRNEGYAATVDSIEPNINPIDPGAFYASAAISLKRIADALEKSAEEKERANKLAKIQLNEIYGKVGKRRLVRLSDWFNAKFALFD